MPSLPGLTLTLITTGKGAYPVGGIQAAADMWTPIQAQSNGNKWVQIGQREGGTCNPLSTYHGSEGGWMTSQVGVPYKGVIACVMAK